MRHPLRIIELYERGAMTLHELQSSVFEALTKENIREFMEACPPDHMSHLKEKAEAMPDDDDEEGWASLISIDSTTYRRETTEEEILAIRKERDDRFRSGLTLFRKTIRNE